MLVEGGLKKAVFIVLFLVFAYFMYRSSVFRITENFDTVVEGKLYRSAQLNEDELEGFIKKYHIKTVISLRGKPGETFWYQGKQEDLSKYGVDFHYLGLSDDFYPDQDQIRKIFEIFKQQNEPILIHCRVGADRTGMISALYKKLMMKSSLEESLKQLSFKYWHVQAFHPAMHLFVEKAKDLNWLMSEYNICLPEFSDYRGSKHVCP